jgi:hypothetical protein
VDVFKEIRCWSGLKWHGIRNSEGSCEQSNEPSSERQLPSQEQLCPMELVSYTKFHRNPSNSFFHLLRIRPIGLFHFGITPEIMNHRHTAGLLGRVISSSQGLYLHRTTQHRKTKTNIHALIGIRTRDPVYERSRPAPQTARPLHVVLEMKLAGRSGPSNYMLISCTSYFEDCKNT